MTILLVVYQVTSSVLGNDNAKMGFPVNPAYVILTTTISNPFTKCRRYYITIALVLQMALKFWSINMWRLTNPCLNCDSASVTVILVNSIDAVVDDYTAIPTIWWYQHNDIRLNNIQ
jgi:hypothetical protein